MVVTLGPYTYIIKLVKGLADRTGTYGCYIGEESLLLIDADLDPISMRDTIIHEMVHAIDDLRGLGFDEKTTNLLGTDLAQMLTDFWFWPPMFVESVEELEEKDNDTRRTRPRNR